MTFLLTCCSQNLISSQVHQTRVVKSVKFPQAVCEYGANKLSGCTDAKSENKMPSAHIGGGSIKINHQQLSDYMRKYEGSPYALLASATLNVESHRTVVRWCFSDIDK